MSSRKVRYVDPNPLECFRFIYNSAMEQLAEDQHISIELPPSAELSKQIVNQERPLELVTTEEEE